MLQHPVHLVPDYCRVVPIACLVVFAQFQNGFQAEFVCLCSEERAEFRVVDVLLTCRVDRQRLIRLRVVPTTSLSR